MAYKVVPYLYMHSFFKKSYKLCVKYLKDEQKENLEIKIRDIGGKTVNKMAA